MTLYWIAGLIYAFGAGYYLRGLPRAHEPQPLFLWERLLIGLVLGLAVLVWPLAWVVVGTISSRQRTES